MKFIFTSPRPIEANKPYPVEADDVLTAICSMGFTVWTEEDYLQATELMAKWSATH